MRGIASCPVCGTSLAEPDRLIHCARCSTPHHADCFDYNGRCAVYACAWNANAIAPAPADDGSVLVIEEPDDQPAASARLFIPVVRREQRWYARRVVAAVAVNGMTAVVVAGLSTWWLLGIVLATGALVGVLERTVGRTAWEIDGERRELAMLTRRDGRMKRVGVESLEATRAVVVHRVNVESRRLRDGTGWYRSSWCVRLRWAGRFRDLTGPEWTDGHAEPPSALLALGKQLAHLVRRPLEIDPPAEGALPPGLGKLPSQM